MKQAQDLLPINNTFFHIFPIEEKLQKQDYVTFIIAGSELLD